MFIRSNKRLRAFAALALMSLMSLISAPGLAAPAKPMLAERIDLIRHGESEDNVDQGKMIARLDGHPVDGRIPKPCLAALDKLAVRHG